MQALRNNITVNSLTERAMLINLKISKWAARKHDKIISREIAQQHGLSDETRGAYRKQLIAKQALEEINSIASEARNKHYELTLSWSDEGHRIITNVHYLKYCQIMRDLQTRFEAAVKNFLKSYPDYQEAAKVDLGTLYREEDYPDVITMSKKFGFQFNVLPLPKADDFRVKGMIDAEVQRVKADIEASSKTLIAETMKEPYKRLQDVLQKYVDKLKAFDPDNAIKSPFRDTLVSNIKDVVDLIPGLNLTDDAELNAFAERIRNEIVSVPADVLRNDDERRETAYKSADAILAEVVEFI